MNNSTTIHTSRTMMFSELEKVMDYSINSENYLDSFQQNITGKKSNLNAEKTAVYLKKLYSFDLGYAPFKSFKYFWKIADTGLKPMLAFIYAVNHDYMLAESVDVIKLTLLGKKASIEEFEDNIEKYHPLKYSPNTRKSMAQNIASTYKQAGFLEGKVRNIRIQPEINYLIACFSFLLAYLKGDRGDFIWNSIGVKALCLPEAKLRELATECSKRDLIQYQYAGNVTVISFVNLLNEIKINVI